MSRQSELQHLRGLSILQAIDSEHLLGAAIRDPQSFGPWRAFLSAAFALPMDDTARALFAECTGRTSDPVRAYAYSWLICGRKAGKSFIMALVAGYLALFKDWQRFLSPGERAIVLLVAQNREQAKILHRYILGILSTPLLAQFIESETTDSIELAGSVAIEVVSCNYRGLRGRSVCVALLDECAFWRTEESASPDTEVFNAIRASQATFGDAARMMVASSPYAKRGILWGAFGKFHGVDDEYNNLVWQASTRTMNPTVPASFIDEEFARDPESASSEYLAQFRADVSEFIGLDLIEAAIDRDRPRELAPRGEQNYAAFVDSSGGRNDAYVVCIAHRDKSDRFIVDVIRGQKAPFNPAHVTIGFAGLVREYNIRKVTGDNFGGDWVADAWRGQGLIYERSDMTASQLYTELLPLFTREMISIPDDPTLIRELRGLERRVGRMGRDQVTHAAGAHDDFANVVAGAARVALAKSNKATLHLIRGGF